MCACWSDGGRSCRPTMSVLTRDAYPPRRPTRLVSSKRSCIAVAIASMFLHVDTKYWEIWSADAAPRPPPAPEWRTSVSTGNATR